MVTYPKDWAITPLSEAVDIYQGGTPKTTIPAYWNGTIVWVTPGEITRLKSLYIENSERKITELGLEKSSACLLPEGTILLCTRATIGDLAIAKKTVATNQGFKNLVCKSNAHNVFLAYLLTTKKEELIEKAIGTTFLEISKKELSKIQVILPSVSEQKRIAKTLSEFDEYIANLEELIEKKKSIRDGALEDLVSGKTRLDGYSGKWKCYPFEQYFSMLTNNTFSRDKLSKRGQIGNIHYGDVLISFGCIVNGNDDIPRINDDVKYMPKHFLQKNDVVIADTAEDEMVGKVTQIGEVDFPLVAGLHTVPCRPLIETADGYLGYYMNSTSYHNQLLPFVTGIKVSSVSKTSFKKTELYLPEDINEQKSIVDILSSMDTEIKNLEEEKEKMLQIKAGAMNDLLTGKVRIVKQGD